MAVAVDGGRVRLRVPNPGRPLANGHRRYEAPWKEPKELTIYVIDNAGQLDESFPVVLDGTLGDADAIFDRLVAYLKALGAHEAELIIVLGDGAEWIWNRADVLAARLGVSPEKLIQIVDKYHAAQYLSETADLLQWNSDGEKKAWVEESKKLLIDGEALQLAEKIDVAFAAVDGTSPKGEDLKKEISDKTKPDRSSYFRDNAKRMEYKKFLSLAYPIGSGAIESGIRRVINLRLKGAGKFWLEENAEHMIRMRSYLKAGRFLDLFLWSLTTAASWWRAPTDLLGRDKFATP